jgi:NADH:ubiquinone oxidoreductase subunit 5 (subunit L)/multisubunit Na+/H+ antiporter MnhA subunit
VIDLALLPTVALFLAAGLELALAPWLSRAAKGWLAFSATATAAAAVVALAARTAGGQVVIVTQGHWDAAIPIAYHVDGLSTLFMLMATIIGGAILLYSVRYLEEEEQGTTRFYILMLSFIGGFTLLVGTSNLLLIYVAWEAMGLCSYFLVGFWYRLPAAVDGARKVLVITHVGGYGLFAAIVMLYVRTGTFDWTDSTMATALTGGLVALLLVAAMAKSVLYPLHTWIPEAMNAPTPVSGLLHSACYVKCGVYLIARMYAIGPWQDVLGSAMILIGCVTMLVGAVFAVAQTDLKRLLAFSTVSQLGYIVTGLALGTDLGVAAGLYYAASHALFKGTLFLCAGAIQHVTGTRDMRRLGGIAARMPVTTVVWLVAAAAIAGVPGTTGFVAKWLLFGAALDARQVVVVAVAWIVSLVTVFYFLKATISVFYGVPAPDLRTENVREVAPSMRVSMTVLATLCIVFGVAPQLLMGPVVAPATRSLAFSWDIQMTWFGVLTGAGAAAVTAGGVAVIGAAALGGLVFGLMHASPARAVAVFTGGDPLPLNDAPGAVDFAEIAQTAFSPVYSLDPDPVYLRIWRLVRDSSARVGALASETAEDHPIATAAVSIAILSLGVWLR